VNNKRVVRIVCIILLLALVAGLVIELVVVALD
jgi:hypothetical protein